MTGPGGDGVARGFDLQVAQIDRAVVGLCSHDCVNGATHSEARSGAQDRAAIVEHRRFVEETAGGTRRDDVGAMLEQQLHHWQVVVGDGEMHAGLAYVRLAQVDAVDVLHARAILLLA